MAESRGTAPQEVSVHRIRRARSLRRAFFVAICVVLLAGAFNVFGVQSASRSASGGGFELEVSYDKVTRPGLATSIEVEVRRAGGFDGPVSVAFTSSYFDALDLNGVDPEPASGTSTPTEVVMTFETPRRGDAMAIGFDARVQPTVQLRRLRATVSVLDASGAPVVSVPLSTFVMP